MFDPALLEVLCCPETHQALVVAGPDQIERLNQQMANGALRNRAGALLAQKLDGGLIRQDRKFLYPIRQGIPVMLVDEAIPLNDQSDCQK